VLEKDYLDKKGATGNLYHHFRGRQRRNIQNL